MSRGWTKVDYRLVAIAGFVMAVFMFVYGLFYGKTVYADSSLTVEILSSETPTSSVSASVAPTINASGTYVKSDNITIKVKTNNNTGYELAVRSNDASHPDRLINTTDDSYLESIASEMTESTFKNTDLSTITTSGGKQGIWGYLPSKYNSADNSSFLPTPGTAGHSLDKTSTANPTTANNYTLAIGAKISQYATVGAYTNSFAIVAVANPNPYTINYVENTGLVTNMPENVIGATTSGSTVTLSSTTPTREGYEFKEWNTSADGTGTAYQPGATYTLASGANLKLYAIWKEITYLQNLSADKCTTTMSTAIDSRDGTEYHIQRLTDGNCWLLDNLALDLATVSLNDLKGNTNASDEVLTYLKNGGGSDQYPANGVIAKTSNSGSWTNSYTDPYIATGYISTVPQGDYDPLKTETSNGNWKIGVYYNYCAASAGSYCYSTSNAPTDSQNGVRNIDADICPKGWHMPTGNASGEYSALASEIYGSTDEVYGSPGSTSDATAYANYRSVLRLPLSGYFYDGSANYQGSGGFWWSSTRIDSSDMNLLSAYTSSIFPAGSNNRYYGYSVRCVLGS